MSVIMIAREVGEEWDRRPCRRRKSTGVVGSNRHMSLLTRIGHFSYTVARADNFGQPRIPPTCQSYRVYPAGCFRRTSGDDTVRISSALAKDSFHLSRLLLVRFFVFLSSSSSSPFPCSLSLS